LVDIRIKYFVHNLEFLTKDLNSICNLLRSSNYIRKKIYLGDEKGEEVELV